MAECEGRLRGFNILARLQEVFVMHAGLILG